MMRLEHRKPLLVGLIACASQMLLDVKPAAAALPDISCTKVGDFNWCVSFNGFYAQAGVGYPTRLTLTFNPPRSDWARVELVYYPGTPAQRGDTIFAGDSTSRSPAEVSFDRRPGSRGIRGPTARGPTFRRSASTPIATASTRTE